MTPKTRLTALGLMLFSLTMCVPSDDTIITNQDKDGRTVILHITSGDAWSSKKAPQIAVWIEDNETGYRETLYVSYKSATGRWAFEPTARRPEALPYWSHRHGVQYADGLYMPTRDEPLPDAVTSATPSHSFKLQSTMPADLESFTVLAELNVSFDYNEFYPEGASPGDDNYSYVNGQPSLIYAATFAPGNDTGTLQLVGTGSLDGSSGELTKDLSTITTAAHLVSSITVDAGEEEE